MDNLKDHKKFNQILIVGILAFTILSGALRKWVIDNGTVNLAITLIQVPILFCLIFLKGKAANNIPVRNAIVIYLFYIIATSFNPLSPSLVHSAAGFIIHVGFLLALSIYILKRDNLNISHMNKLVLGLVLLEITLGFIQYASPRESVINKYVTTEVMDNEEEAALKIATVGDAVRISGTFSYIAGYVSFILFLQLYNFSLFFNKKIKKEIPTYLSIVIIVLSFLTGSRACVLFTITSTIAFFLFQFRDFKKLNPMKFVIQAVILLIINTAFNDFFGINEAVQHSYENFTTRLNDNSEEGELRLLLPFQRILDNDFPNKLFGNGLAISYPAVVALMGTSQVAITHWVQDDEISRTLLEGGYMLLLFKICLLAILIHSLSLNKFFSFVIFALVFLYFPLTTNIYNSVFFLFGIVYLDQSIRFK